MWWGIWHHLQCNASFQPARMKAVPPQDDLSKDWGLGWPEGLRVFIAEQGSFVSCSEPWIWSPTLKERKGDCEMLASCPGFTTHHCPLILPLLGTRLVILRGVLLPPPQIGHVLQNHIVWSTYRHTSSCFLNNFCWKKKTFPRGRLLCQGYEYSGGGEGVVVGSFQCF